MSWVSLNPDARYPIADAERRADANGIDVARLVNGIGTGILNAIVPVWATETAEHTSRGQFIAIEFTLNIFGVVVAYWLELYVSNCWFVSTWFSSTC